MKNVRKPMIATIALGVAMAMPMAFAQEATTAEQAPPTTTQDYAQDATAEAPQAQQGQVTWADLDTDGDGRLSQAEANGLEGLGQAFSQIDADATDSSRPRSIATS